MSKSVIDQFIGIARPGDVVILGLKQRGAGLLEETKRSIEGLQAAAPGVTFMLLDADGFRVDIREAQEAQPGAQR